MSRVITQIPEPRRHLLFYYGHANGSVWKTELDVDGKPSQAPRVLARRTSVKQFFVSSDSLYLLHDSGNIWAGRLTSDSEVDLRFVDGGAGTRQIFAAAGVLYVLKTRGNLWRVTDPLGEPRFEEIFDPPRDDGFIEMFVTPCQDDPIADVGAPPECLTHVYLRRGDGEVYRGLDFGTGPVADVMQIRSALKYGSEP